MKVKDLMAILSGCGGNMEVAYYWDGCPRSNVNGVFERNGEIVLCDTEEPASYDKGETIWIKKP